MSALYDVLEVSTEAWLAAVACVDVEIEELVSCLIGGDEGCAADDVTAAAAD